MLKFMVTFGQRYRSEEHPADARIHPDGVVVVWARDRFEARQMVESTFESSWSDLRRYDAGDVKQFYPRGVLFTLKGDES